MQDFAAVVGYHAVLFAVVGGITYWLATRRRRMIEVCRLEPGQKVRVRSGRHLYRTRLAGETAEGWIFEAPISRDHFVPLRIGEEVVIEATCRNGVLLYRTNVIARALYPHTFTVSRPSGVAPMDRRGAPRYDGLRWPHAFLDDHPVELVDVSNLGCCLRSSRPVAPVTFVNVRLSFHPTPVPGQVIDCERVGDGHLVHIRFAEAVPIPIDAAA